MTKTKRNRKPIPVIRRGIVLPFDWNPGPLNRVLMQGKSLRQVVAESARRGVA